MKQSRKTWKNKVETKDKIETQYIHVLHKMLKFTNLCCLKERQQIAQEMEERRKQESENENVKVCSVAWTPGVAK